MAVSDIYSGNALIQPKSIQDFDNENMLMQAKRQQIQQGALGLQDQQMKMEQARNVLAQRQALQQAIQSGQIDISNPEHAPRALALAPDVAPGMLTSIGTYQKDRAQVAKDEGAGANSQQEAKTKAFQLHQSQLPLVRNQQDMSTWIDGLFADPATRDAAIQVGGSPDQAKARIPQDPAQFQQYLQQNAMGMDKYVQDQTAKRGQNISAQTQLTTSAATNTAHLQGIGAQQAGENTRAAATLKKDYAINGMDANGNFTGFGAPAIPAPAGGPAPQVGAGRGVSQLPGATPSASATPAPLSALVDAIGKYQVPIGVALQRTPVGMRDYVMAQVQSKYPTYDGAQFAARNQSVKDFAPGGKDAAAIESGNTALNHLDTLRRLAEAQANGNIPLFNKVANEIAANTGRPAPTNLAGGVTLVGPEISKAVVGAGGGQGDREKIDSALAALVKGSPAQASGTVATMEDIFGGRLTEKQRSYERGTGLTDFEAPGRFLSPAAARVLAMRKGESASGGMPSASDIDAEIARRAKAKK